jgi:hypothetical protein
MLSVSTTLPGFNENSNSTTELIYALMLSISTTLPGFNEKSNSTTELCEKFSMPNFTQIGNECGRYE